LLRNPKGKGRCLCQSGPRPAQSGKATEGHAAVRRRGVREGQAGSDVKRGTPTEDKQLGTMPDAEQGAKLGVDLLRWSPGDE